MNTPLMLRVSKAARSSRGQGGACTPKMGVNYFTLGSKKKATVRLVSGAPHRLRDQNAALVDP
jgi:hypothetical protein